MKPSIITESSNLITSKMRDEMYMKHLREVQKINNREVDRLYKEIKKYKSITEMHGKNKMHASKWQHKEEDQIIKTKNTQITDKCQNIKSYLKIFHKNRKFDQNVQNSLGKQTEGKTEKQKESLFQVNNEEENNKKSIERIQRMNKPKKILSLHYRYRKRQQQQIQFQNEKLAKGILSQRSTYLPKIKHTNRSVSVTGSLKSQTEEPNKSKLHGQL